MISNREEDYGKGQAQPSKPKNVKDKAQARADDLTSIIEASSSVIDDVTNSHTEISNADLDELGALLGITSDANNSNLEMKTVSGSATSPSSEKSSEADTVFLQNENEPAKRQKTDAWWPSANQTVIRVYVRSMFADDENEVPEQFDVDPLCTTLRDISKKVADMIGFPTWMHALVYGGHVVFDGTQQLPTNDSTLLELGMRDGVTLNLKLANISHILEIEPTKQPGPHINAINKLLEDMDKLAITKCPEDGCPLDNDGRPPPEEEYAQVVYSTVESKPSMRSIITQFSIDHCPFRKIFRCARKLHAHQLAFARQQQQDQKVYVE